MEDASRATRCRSLDGQAAERARSAARRAVAVRRARRRRAGRRARASAAGLSRTCSSAVSRSCRSRSSSLSGKVGRCTTSAISGSASASRATGHVEPDGEPHRTRSRSSTSAPRKSIASASASESTRARALAQHGGHQRGARRTCPPGRSSPPARRRRDSPGRRAPRAARRSRPAGRWPACASAPAAASARAAARRGRLARGPWPAANAPTRQGRRRPPCSEHRRESMGGSGSRERVLTAEPPALPASTTSSTRRSFGRYTCNGGLHVAGATARGSGRGPRRSSRGCRWRCSTCSGDRRARRIRRRAPATRRSRPRSG